MRMMGAESVEYHRATVLGRVDDYPGRAMEYYASRGETPLVWGGAGAASLGLAGAVSAESYEALFGPGGAKDPRTGEQLVQTRRPGMEIVIAALAVVESHCRRDLGQNGEAVAAAERAVQLAQASGDDYELMLTLEERLAAKRAAGDLAGFAADALEVKRLIWAVHQRQTVQIAEQIWERAALERERRQFEEQAEEDALTCIGNRRRLKRFLDDAAETPSMLALVMADIDLFKEVNDTFGHELGDMVLRALGELLAGEARSGQVVVRYGGEEFVFAMPGADLAAAASFAERARLLVASYPWRQVDPRLAVTISLGVSCGRSDEWPSVLAEADSALYLAKRRGRNRVEMAIRALEQTAG